MTYTAGMVAGLDITPGTVGRLSRAKKNPAELAAHTRGIKDESLPSQTSISRVPLIRKTSPLYMRLSELKGRELQVLIVLIAHADNETGECWPSIDTIEQAAGLNRKTVMAATKGLADKQFIEKRRGKREVGTIYRVVPEVRKAGQQKPAKKPCRSTTKGTSGKPSRQSRSPVSEGAVVPKSRAQKSQNRGFPLYMNSPKNSPKNSELSCASSPPDKPAALCLVSDHESPPASKRSSRKPDPLFDAVAVCHGIKLGVNIPKAVAKRISPIAAELRAMDATPEDVRKRYDWIISEYSGATINALPKHWQAAGRCLASGQSPSTGRSRRKLEPNARPEDMEAGEW